MDNSLAVFVIILATIFDAVRDSTYGRWPWLPWHGVKWIAFYSPLVYIVWREGLPMFDVFVLAAICFGLWEVVSRLAKRPWKG